MTPAALTADARRHHLLSPAQDYPMLAGNLVALFWSAIVTTVLSYIWPQVSSAAGDTVCVSAPLCLESGWS